MISFELTESLITFRSNRTLNKQSSPLPTYAPFWNILAAAELWDIKLVT
jgi:hypothetical protein